MLPLQDITERIIGMAMEIHRTMGSGFVESVYHNALCLELTDAGIPFESKPKIDVFYKGKVVGQFEPDIIIIVEKRLILELKSVENIAPAHEAQCVNYLTATQIDDGLIINFGSRKLQVRRKFRIYQKQPFKEVVEVSFTHKSSPDRSRQQSC